MLGTELRTRRTEAGISGALVSKHTGIARSRISDIERGHVQPSVAEIEKLERALDKLIRMKKKLKAVAARLGWPTTQL